MPPFTCMTAMTPDNVTAYVADFSAETTVDKQMDRLLWMLEGWGMIILLLCGEPRVGGL